MTAQPPYPHGSLAEEATRLVEAVQGWLGSAQRAAPIADDPWAQATAAYSDTTDVRVPAHVGDSAECAICPICRSIRFVRTISPEAVEHLVDAGTALLAALSDLRRPPSAPRRPDESDSGT